MWAGSGENRGADLGWTTGRKKARKPEGTATEPWQDEALAAEGKPVSGAVRPIAVSECHDTLPACAGPNASDRGEDKAVGPRKRVHTERQGLVACPLLGLVTAWAIDARNTRSMRSR